jgi:hypothetical protein
VEFASNKGFWSVGSKRIAALDFEDLEGAAWIKLVSIPNEKIGRDENGALIQNYLLESVKNYLIDERRVAGGRWKKMSQADYEIGNETPSNMEYLPADTATAPSKEKRDDREGGKLLWAELRKLHKAEGFGSHKK